MAMKCLPPISMASRQMGLNKHLVLTRLKTGPKIGTRVWKTSYERRKFALEVMRCLRMKICSICLNCSVWEVMPPLMGQKMGMVSHRTCFHHHQISVLMRIGTVLEKLLWVGLKLRLP